MAGMIPGLTDIPVGMLQDPLKKSSLPGLNGMKVPGTIRSLDDARELYDKAASPEELKLREVASEFVSILQSTLYKQMDAGIERTGLLGGGAMEEAFRPMLIDEYTKLGSGQQGNMLTYRVYEMMYNATIATKKPGDGATESSAPMKSIDLPA